jgi:ABC-type dipeptide/oligopeptide/nickel transport system ATPase component
MRVGEEERYVEAAEVRKVYRSGTAEAIEAVSSVSFTVARGQFVAVLGRSGCGKSTLLMMVGGLPPGCVFSSRCQHAEPSCREAEPVLLDDAGHAVACPRWRDIGPVVGGRAKNPMLALA